ncbi:MAG: type 1 glutamine amidotransferase [Syntrophobacterales bacterium]|nr:type 1 glutamine amidotransferase [Syntrophobacterales bacterium]
MPTSRPVIIIQHMEWEGPGEHLQQALKEFQVPWQVVEVWRQPLPDPIEVGGLVVLGGTPNVDEEDRFPYLRPLKALIREVVQGGVPYLGFCLGHQLLAHVLGCRVGPLPRKCIGYREAELTPAGRAHPAFAGLPRRFPVFSWHGQGVLPPLPPGLEILAGSPEVPVQALGPATTPQVLGLQFDNHAGTGDVARWLEADAAWALLGSGVDPDALKEEAGRQDPEVGRWFRQFLGNFCRLAGWGAA